MVSMMLQSMSHGIKWFSFGGMGSLTPPRVVTAQHIL